MSVASIPTRAGSRRHRLSSRAASSLLTDEQLIVAARDAADAADAAEAEAGSASRWKQADCYAELAARGRMTQREIAAAVAVSQSLVSFYVACVRDYPVIRERPLFRVAFHAVKRGAAGAFEEGYRRPSFRVPSDDPHAYLRAGLQHYSLDELRLALEELIIAVEERDSAA